MIDPVYIIGAVNVLLISPIYFILGGIRKDINSLKDTDTKLSHDIGVLEGKIHG